MDAAPKETFIALYRGPLHLALNMFGKEDVQLVWSTRNKRNYFNLEEKFELLRRYTRPLFYGSRVS